MFKNLKGIKFEKINMKIVVAVGIVVILIITAVFIIFRTNLIVDRSKKNNPSNSNSNPTSNISNNSNSNSNTSNSNSNPNYEDPDDDEDELIVSEEAKKRTKVYTKLNVEEKKFIIEENFNKRFEKDSDAKSRCSTTNSKIKSGKTKCFVYAEHFIDYAQDAKTGYAVKNCTGKVYYTYDSTKKEYILDFSKTTCKNG